MAGDFIDERIDLCARYGTSFEEGFTVTHEEDDDGTEYSHLHHPYPKLRYELNFANADQDGLAKRVSDLYQRSAGTFHYFRVKHYAEFTTHNKTQAPTATDQLLIDISTDEAPNTYQLVSWYATPSEKAARRLITKPIVGTVLVAINGVAVDSGDYVVDYSAGKITFIFDPAGIVTGGCSFDIPMRFAANYAGVFNNLGVISSVVNLIEVLDAGVT